jgi:hypothetical protein
VVIAFIDAHRSRFGVETPGGWEGVLFVVPGGGVEAVVELAEEPVVQVA